MYKILLSDGTILENIEINITTFISKIPIDDSIFDHNLSPVDIELIGDSTPFSSNGFEGHHENMEYIRIEGAPSGEYWFSLQDIPESEMKYAKIRSDIEYIAMMNDVEL